MDATAVSIITSGITGTLAFGGIALQVRASMNKSKAEGDIAAKNADVSAASRVDDRIWKYIAQLEQDRDTTRTAAERATVRLEKALADLSTDHIALQNLYKQVLMNMETLELQRIKNQSQIQELLAELRLLKGTA